MMQRLSPLLRAFDVHWHACCCLSVAAVSGRSSQEERSRSSLPTLTINNLKFTRTDSPADIKGNHPLFVCYSLSFITPLTSPVLSVSSLSDLRFIYAVRIWAFITIKWLKESSALPKRLSVLVFFFLLFSIKSINSHPRTPLWCIGKKNKYSQ